MNAHRTTTDHGRPPRRPRRRAWLLVPALIVLAGACVDPNNPTGTTAPPSTGTVTRLAAGGASAAVISRNARFVAFVSSATSPGTDGNGTAGDVFVVDRQSATTVRVSGGDGAADSPSVADDGTVVFRSTSTDLGGAPDTNGHADVFVWTVADGVQRVTDSAGDVTAPLISADGSTVVFGAPESLTTSGGATVTEAYRWQPSSPSTITPVTASLAGGAVPVAVSADGARVLLAEPGRLSMSENPTVAATPVAAAPASPAAPQVKTFSVAPHALADDGDAVFSEVTYSYNSSTHVLGFLAGALRRWDHQSATVANLGTTGVPGGPVISGDGTRLVLADHSGVSVDQDDGAAFLRGAIRTTNATGGASMVVASSPTSSFGTVSADGRYVAFVSTATNLALPDPNGAQADVYLWDRGS